MYLFRNIRGATFIFKGDKYKTCQTVLRRHLRQVPSTASVVPDQSIRLISTEGAKFSKNFGFALFSSSSSYYLNVHPDVTRINQLGFIGCIYISPLFRLLFHFLIDPNLTL